MHPAPGYRRHPPSGYSAALGRPGAGELCAPGTGVPAPPAERVLSRLGAARRRLSQAEIPTVSVATNPSLTRPVTVVVWSVTPSLNTLSVAKLMRPKLLRLDS